jgi:ferritin-like metal-binding protein YciE
MTELGARESKLVQYLNEAYGKEKELEVALHAHIGMTTRAPYKKRLRQHLTETKRHARELERRVKKIGGTPQTVPIDVPGTVAKGAGAAVGIVSRAAAAAQGPLHAIRGTSAEEKMLKNAKSEYSDEHEEIATYAAIETLAEALGDSDTAKLARAIRREEESMANFLAKQIPVLTRAVIQAEIPTSERAAARRRSSGANSSGGSRTSRPRSNGSSATRSGATSSSATRSDATSSRSATRSGVTRSGAARSGAARSGAARSKTAARSR